MSIYLYLENSYIETLSQSYIIVITIMYDWLNKNTYSSVYIMLSACNGDMALA